METVVEPTSRLAHIRAFARKYSGELFLLTCWFIAILPEGVQTFTQNKWNSTVSEEGETSGMVRALKLLLIVVLLIWAAVSVTGVVRRRTAGNRVSALLIALLPFTVWHLSSIASGTMPSPSSLAIPLVLLIGWALAPRLETWAVLGHATAALAAVSMLMAAFVPFKGILIESDGYISSPDKSLIFGSLLVGPYPHSNALGSSLVMGLIGVLAVKKLWLRYSYLVIVGVALVWTSSRTAYYALVVIIIFAAARWIFRGKLREIVFALGLIGVTLIALALPLWHWRDTAFSARGAIWKAVREGWEQSPFIGNGQGWFQVLWEYENGLVPYAHNGHNQFAQVLVTGGIVGILALLALLALLIVRSLKIARTGNYLAVYYTAALITLGMMNVPITGNGMGTNFTFTWPLIALVLFGTYRTQTTTEPVAESASDAVPVVAAAAEPTRDPQHS